jgi:O-methyltransferase involved in polyketide biosynthesis
MDLPNMVAEKRRALGRSRTPPNYFLGTADLLAQDFIESLHAVPRPGDHVVVVTEGVTDYFNMSEKRTAFHNICSLLRAQGGGHYLLEIYAREHFPNLPLVTPTFVRALGHVVGRSFDELLFERVDHALQFVIDCGFDAATELDLAELNTSIYQPPVEDCTYRIVEAVVEEER